MPETSSHVPSADEAAPVPTPIDTERLRALLAASTPGPFTADCLGSEGYAVSADGTRTNRAGREVAWRNTVARCGLLDWDTDKANAALVAEALTALPGLLDEVERLSAENEALWDDVLRAVTERNEVAERAAAEFIPGPDGQDDIDRRALVQQWLDDGRDGAESWRTSWQKAAERAVAAEAEVERLRAEVEGDRVDGNMLALVLGMAEAPAPVVGDSIGAAICVLCDAESGTSVIVEGQHRPGCPWVEARQIAARLHEDVQPAATPDPEGAK